MRYFLVLLLLVTSFSTYSQSYTFQHLSAKHGLAPTAINDIYQDELGVMWFATRGGLNRFDGNKNTLFNPPSISGEFQVLSSFSSIHGDKKGRLFLFMKAAGKLVAFDKVLASNAVQLVQGENVVNVPANLVKGIYLARLSSNDGQTIVKFAK